MARYWDELAASTPDGRPASESRTGRRYERLVAGAGAAGTIRLVVGDGSEASARSSANCRCYHAGTSPTGGIARVSIEPAETTATPKGAWRLDTANGSMAPRSALDVLVDLNDHVTTGNIGEYQPVPLGLHAARQDDRRRPAARRAAAHRRRPGHRQDHDGPPDGPQRRLGRPGQRPVHLLRARGAVPAQPADRDGVGPRPPAPQDRRDQDPGRPQGDPRHLDGRRLGRPRSWPTTRASGRRSTGSPATARTCSSCAARRPSARSTTSATSSASTRRCRATGACSSSSTTSRRCRSSPSRRPSRRR